MLRVRDLLFPDLRLGLAMYGRSASMLKTRFNFPVSVVTAVTVLFLSGTK